MTKWRRLGKLEGFIRLSATMVEGDLGNDESMASSYCMTWRVVIGFFFFFFECISVFLIFLRFENSVSKFVVNRGDNSYHVSY